MKSSRLGEKGRLLYYYYYYYSIIIARYYRVYSVPDAGLAAVAVLVRVADAGGLPLQNTRRRAPLVAESTPKEKF